MKSATLSQQLQQAANKYENPCFFEKDPSQFLLFSDKSEEIELVSFFAAMMSFGRRDQFIPKIRQVLNTVESGKTFYQWIVEKEYKDSIQKLAFNIHKTENLEKKFYRLYSYSDLIDLFDNFQRILQESEKQFGHGSFGLYFRKKYENSVFENSTNADLADLIAEEFSNCNMVPHTKSSCKKKIYMFLRWMVRQNSPVDLGIWNWYPQNKLVIPMDTHVIQEAEKLGLIEKNAPANIKTARALTAKLNEIFPGDPTRGDYALFGIGVDKQS